MININFKKLHPDVKIPVKAHKSDAGFDLLSLEDVIIKHGERHNFALGLALEVPVGYVAMVQGKSGLANNYGINTIGNIIDSGYRGECHAILHNSGKINKSIKRGDKIAQLLFIKLSQINELHEVKELIDTDRGSGGFGSTGK